MRKLAFLLFVFIGSLQANAQDFSPVLSPAFQNAPTLEKLKKLSEFKKQRKLNSTFVRQYASRLLYVAMVEEFGGKKKKNTPGMSGISRARATANSMKKGSSVSLAKFAALDSKLKAKNISTGFEPSVYNYALISLFLKKMKALPTPKAKYDFMKAHNKKMRYLKTNPSYYMILAVKDINLQPKDELKRLAALQKYGHPTNKSLEFYFFYKRYKNLLTAKKVNYQALNNAIMDLEKKKLLSKFGASDLQKDLMVWQLIEDKAFMALPKPQRKARINQMHKSGKVTFFVKSTLINMFTK